ncbi:transglutaminase-like cysteine peptidase [uncultured Ferrimonas sp.]|uniref:transglutaminase-like cysteine peptidase n=1 Tax=uncultured Ferrimonas sp. TaxID=432640 RepID=UPI002601DA4F|nr:transglutaminase-like cysteine peptidase [uncultured Ferrimonas sp.]
MAAITAVMAANPATPPEHQLQQQQRLLDRYGDQAALRYRAWRKLLLTQQQQTPMAKAEAINTFFNQFRFGNDSTIWGQKNYWATPMEFIGLAYGDCEDFALAKYLSLQMLGLAEQSLRLVYVKATQLNQYHMVVAYYPTPQSEPWILDNLNGNIVKASKRPDLKPIFSFSGDKFWLDGASGSRQVANRPALSQWTQFSQRRLRGQMNLPPYLKD